MIKPINIVYWAKNSSKHLVFGYGAQRIFWLSSRTPRVSLTSCPGKKEKRKRFKY